VGGRPGGVPVGWGECVFLGGVGTWTSGLCWVCPPGGRVFWCRPRSEEVVLGGIPLGRAGRSWGECVGAGGRADPMFLSSVLAFSGVLRFGFGT